MRQCRTSTLPGPARYPLPQASAMLRREHRMRETAAGRGVRVAYGLGIAKGLLVTFKHIFRPPITVSYPEEERDVPLRARTNLLWFEERCTGCSTCAQACPDGCILVETSPRADGTLNIDRYEIDFRICMYCGLCT
ncbi:MAG: 4Fe-4S dicluster domain-containing protein, partial [Chloroflexi bacterium]|nr:4Fe-4S dicluster domain-containing protein [Chloroflexota bacterium]